MKNKTDFNFEELRNCAFYKFNFSSRKFEFISPSFSALTGFTVEEINNTGLQSFVKTIIDTENTELKADDTLFSDQYSRYMIQTKNGEAKLIEDRALVEYNSDGSEKHSFGMLYDLSYLTDFIEDVKLEKENLSSFLGITDAIFFAVDKDEKLSFVNRRGRELLSSDYSETENILWYDYLTPDKNYAFLKNKFEMLLNEKEKTFKPFELSILTREKEEKILRMHYSVVKNQENKVCSVLFAGTDITGQQHNEKIGKLIIKILDASNTESNLNELFEFIHSSIIEVMPANNFYIALYDEKEDMISFPYFVDQKEKTISPQKFGTGLTEYVIRNGKPCLCNKVENEKLIKEGKIQVVGPPATVWLGVPLKSADHTFGAMVVQDYENEKTFGEIEKNALEFISFIVSRAIERKKNELEKNEMINELKDHIASKDRLISHISHDLRSPFNSLLGFSEILTTEYESLTKEEIQEYLQVIYEASKNLFGMTNNLLQFSRFQMGRLEFKPAKLNLLKLINKNLNLLKGIAIKKQINLTLDVNKNISVFADEDLLGSIIQNLISNAIKFTERQGEIKIICRFSDDSNFVEMIVRDSGIGINPVDLKKIFKENYYSTPGTEREYGTGLGLILVKEFVEKNGGKLKVNSIPNQGSTFQFTIPVTGTKF